MKKLILICLLASNFLQAQVIKMGNTTLNKGGKGDMVINFNDCVFDVSDLATLDLITNNYANTGGTLTLNFNYCLFKSKTSKTLNITSGTAVAGLTINNLSPTYRSVTLN